MRSSLTIKQPIKIKISILLLAVLIVVTAASTASSFLFFWNDFQELERRDADRDRDKIRNGFFSSLNRLHDFNTQWSSSDATYKFISASQKERQEYIEQNLKKSTFWNANLDMVLFIDNQQQVVWAQSFDSTSGKTTSLRPEVLEFFSNFQPFSKAGKYGIFANESSAYFTSTRPILSSNGNGPRKGYLTLMRKIDQDFIHSFNVEYSTEINVGVLPKSVPTLAKLNKNEGWGQTITDKYRKAFFHTNSLDNKYTIRISVQSERMITEKAHVALVWNSISVLLSISLVFIALLISLDIIVIYPLKKMADKIVLIGQDEAEKVTLEEDRKDEIGLISHEVNRMQDRIFELALNDHLTKLPNRRLFEDRMSSSLERAKRENTQIALLFLDLNGFKNVNDTLGHQIGDELLVRVARRLKSIVRASDSLARLGGDEFGLIMELGAQEDLRAVEIVCNKIVDTLLKPFFINDHEIYISTSIGISTYPDDAATASDIIRFADVAMYAAKADGEKFWQFYQSNMEISEPVNKRSSTTKAK